MLPAFNKIYWASDKMKELKQEIKEVFKARENLRAKCLLHPDENSKRKASKLLRFAIHEDLDELLLITNSNVHVVFTISIR